MPTSARWIALLVLAVSACATPGDPLERGLALKEAQHKYTEALRWGNFDKAAHYVDPAMRDDFLSLAGAFDNVRITDYDIGEVDMNQDTLAHAEVDVTYRGYALPAFIERRVRDHQVWYRDDESGSEWRVRPELRAMLASIGAHN